RSPSFPVAARAGGERGCKGELAVVAGATGLALLDCVHCDLRRSCLHREQAVMACRALVGDPVQRVREDSGRNLHLSRSITLELHVAEIWAVCLYDSEGQK